LYVVIINIFKDRRGVEHIIYAVTASALLLSAYAIFQKFTGMGIMNSLWQAEETRRVTSVFPYPNALALYLAPITALATAFFMGNIKTLGVGGRVFFVLVIILSLIAIIFARSEGGLVAAVAGILVAAWLFGGVWRIFSYGFVLLALFFFTLQPIYGDYIFQKMTLRDLSGEIRKQQWRETMEMLSQNKIITGSGLANYQMVIKPYHQEGIFYNKDADPDFRRKIVLFNEEYKSKYWQPVEIYLYPHNIVLNFWTELGLAGLILFSWIIIKFIIKAGSLIRAHQEYIAVGLVGAMTAFVIHGIVDVPYFKNDLAVFFWIMLGMLVIAEHILLAKEK
jgi:O-antigen ligase